VSYPRPPQVTRPQIPDSAGVAPAAHPKQPFYTGQTDNPSCNSFRIPCICYAYLFNTALFNSRHRTFKTAQPDFAGALDSDEPSPSRDWTSPLTCGYASRLDRQLVIKIGFAIAHRNGPLHGGAYSCVGLFAGVSVAGAGRDSAWI
jgi:hypothetical protein